MEEKYGFVKMPLNEFYQWLKSNRIGRTVLFVQEHHTFRPNYTHFTGKNHFDLQFNMKNYHVHHNGWSDIGQHFSIFPDGMIVTGRSMERSPACIYANNANAVCIEAIGNFDKSRDAMNSEQEEAIVGATASLCAKFGIPVNVHKIVYHHWFNLATGHRNDGAGSNKSCPGTNFFGGNKVKDCEANFLPRVQQAISGVPPGGAAAAIKKYVIITASRLRIRKGPGTQFPKATDRASLIMGAVLRIYKENDNGWLKISSSADHWISGRYTDEVKRAVVNAHTLNVRLGPGTDFEKIESIKQGFEVFIQEEKDNWCKISMEDRWVFKTYLDFI